MSSESKALNKLQQLPDHELEAKALRLYSERSETQSYTSESTRTHIRRVLGEARNRELPVALMSKAEMAELENRHVTRRDYEEKLRLERVIEQDGKVNLLSRKLHMNYLEQFSRGGFSVPFF